MNPRILRLRWLDLRAELDYTYDCFYALVNEGQEHAAWKDIGDYPQGKYKEEAMLSAAMPQADQNLPLACVEVMAELDYVQTTMKHYRETGALLRPWAQRDVGDRIAWLTAAQQAFDKLVKAQAARS